MKKKGNKRKYISQGKMYLFCLIIGMILVLVSYIGVPIIKICKYCCDSCGFIFLCLYKLNEMFTEFVKNIGFGIIASTIVSILIDIANTKMKDEADKRYYDRVERNLKEKCSYFPNEVHVAVVDAGLYNGSKEHVFEWWIKRLFVADEYTDEQKKQIEFIIDTVDDIYAETRNLYNLGRYISNNYWFDGKFDKEMKTIMNQCVRARHCAKCGKYENSAEVIYNELKKAILTHFPDLTQTYNEEFDENTFDN